MKKKWIIIIGILAILGALYGFYMYNKPVKSLENADADYQLTATELLETYENNEEKANARFLDKVIQVSGVVEKVENENDKTSIYLKTDNIMSSVICELDDRNQETQVQSGDEITVKGLCSGYLMDVVLIRTVII